MSDLERRARLLIAQIEDAFADVPYPGDDGLVSNPQDGEAIDIMFDFAGKHWRQISVRDIAEGGHRGDLPLFSPEGFRFYLPAYLLACIADPDLADLALYSVLGMLTKPEGQDSGLVAYMEERMGGFGEEQRVAIRDFLRYIREGASDEFLVRDVQSALEYWEGTTDEQHGTTSARQGS